MSKKDYKVITKTARKVIIKIDELPKVLSEEELKQFHKLVEKMEAY